MTHGRPRRLQRREPIQASPAQAPSKARSDNRLVKLKTLATQLVHMNAEKSQAKARKLLHDVFKFMANSNESPDARQSVWEVLTALRGPDSGDDMLKEQTTQRIRGALYTFAGRPVDEDIQNKGYDSVLGSLVSPFAPIEHNVRLGRPNIGIAFHFMSHVNLAEQALGRLGIVKGSKVVPYAKLKRSRKSV